MLILSERPENKTDLILEKSPKNEEKVIPNSVYRTYILCSGLAFWVLNAISKKIYLCIARMQSLQIYCKPATCE